METLTIQPNDNLSINDLTALQEQGFSVLRSAHVGNMAPYNLSLADAGIPMLLVDHNVTGADKNYFPQFVLSQGEQTRVAEDGTVASRTIVSGGQYLDEFHVGAMKEALPNATLFTNTEYLRQNEVIAGEIVLLGVTHFPEEFKRIVLPDGTTSEVAAADMVSQLGVMQLNDEPRGEDRAVLMPNNMDILINFVVETLQSERDVQYHISGPDMILYMKDPGRRDMFGKFYEIIKREASFGRLLPAELTVQLVVATSARFATSLEYQSEMSELFAQMDASTIALSALAARQKAFFESDAKNDSDVRKAFEKSANQQRFALEQAIADRAEQVPGLFVAPKNEQGFVTQYDVIKDGGLFVAPQNRELSFSALTALTKRLTGLRKKRTP